MRRYIAPVLRIDAKAVDRPFALRCAIGVVAAILGGFAFHQPLLAVACAMGAMSVGFGSLQGVYRTRVAIMLAMALAMSLSTLTGTLAGHSVPLEIVLLALWGAGYGLIASLGASASAVGLNATIAFIIFSNFPLAPLASAEAALFVFAGGLIQIVLLVLSWPIQRYPEERHALAAAFSSLATYASAIDCKSPMVPPVTTMTAVRRTLSDPRPFGRRAALAAFQTLLDECERIRATLGRIATTSCAPYLEVRDVVARVLTELSSALDAARPPSDPALCARLDATVQNEDVRALFGQLRAAWRNVAIPYEGISLAAPSLATIEWFDVEESLAVLRSSLFIDSPFGRHALRLAATLAVTGALAHVLPLQRGYWMTLTAAIVLRPDFTTTLTRGIARIVGTLIGVVVATALVVTLPNTPVVALALAIVFAAAGYATFQMNYALYSVTITAYVVFILSLLGTPEETAVISRSVATLAGGALAMLASIGWPTWEAPNTRVRILALIEADRAYTRTLLSGLIDPQLRDVDALHAERSAVWAVRAKADESLERMLGEPDAATDISPDLARGLMAATRRLGLANLALATIYESPDTPPLPELARFATALETAFATIDALLRGEPAAPSASALRDAYAELRRQLTWKDGEALLASLDIAVDAINTVRDLARAALGLPA